MLMGHQPHQLHQQQQREIRKRMLPKITQAPQVVGCDEDLAKVDKEIKSSSGDLAKEDRLHGFLRKFELLRGVVFLVVFFLICLPFQWYVLDARRRPDPEIIKQKIMDAICPPGLSFNRCSLSSL